MGGSGYMYMPYSPFSKLPLPDNSQINFHSYPDQKRDESSLPFQITPAEDRHRSYTSFLERQGFNLRNHVCVFIRSKLDDESSLPSISWAFTQPSCLLLCITFCIILFIKLSSNIIFKSFHSLALIRR